MNLDLYQFQLKNYGKNRDKLLKDISKNKI